MKDVSKTKAIVMVVCIVVLIGASIFVVRFIQNLMVSATKQLQTMGEMPIVEKVEEEQWAAPTMDPYDIEAGIDNVAAEYYEENPIVIDTSSENEDLQSVAVVDTVDELADTVDEALPADVHMDSVIEDTPPPADENATEAG